MTTEYTQPRPSAPRGDGPNGSSAPGGRGPGGPGGRPGGRPRGRFFRQRRRICPCVEGKQIDYKDVDFIKRFVNDMAKIESRRKTGMCSKCQRPLAIAVKRARYLALIPYDRYHSVGQARSFT
ncbi:MAG: 30S ribosomal protein S18 [SAR202 cluster bacterium]|nr:30S ribosomal protein S18 [SAR202 cluster bacterium]